MFLPAVAILAIAACFLALSFSKRRPDREPAMPQPGGSSVLRLLAVSFLVIFAELVFIRWLAVEVRVFAYFKNLALLLAFLGFGIGCALAREPLRWNAALRSVAALFILVLLPLPGWKEKLEGLSQLLGGTSDAELFSFRATWEISRFLLGTVIALPMFLFLAQIFVPLGQIVSREIEASRRVLYGYTWNLFGSLLGIIAFLLVSRQMYPPVVWMAVVLLLFAGLQQTWRYRAASLVLLLAGGVLLWHGDGGGKQVKWTPYQQIALQPVYFPETRDLLGYAMLVNRTGYQTLNNLSSAFLEEHPYVMSEPAGDNPYNIAYRFAVPAPRTLILGAGAGNDAAAALRHGSTNVDAVEIDPAIYSLGRSVHPERPYSSEHVRAHVTDARAFLRRSTERNYDLIMFGLLDSHTQFSDYSNMRLDNFVYTLEALQEAKALLAPDGVLFLKFEVRLPWLGKRLASMLTEVFGKEPLVFFAPSSYTTSATCFVISVSDRVEAALAADEELRKFTSQDMAFLAAREVPHTTDDWPYLYNQGKWIPRPFLGITVIVMLVAMVLYRQVRKTASHTPKLFFFAMGAGFMLLQTTIISRLALFFGTTWQVSGIVIGSILAALMLSNLVVLRMPALTSSPLVRAGLLGTIGVAYFAPLNELGLHTAWAGVIASVVFVVPVFFAGLLFASRFKSVASPSQALAVNMLGAAVGGMLENLSFMLGLGSLLAVAFVLYLVAVLSWKGHGAAPVPESFAS